MVFEEEVWMREDIGGLLNTVYGLCQITSTRELTHVAIGDQRSSAERRFVLDAFLRFVFVRSHGHVTIERNVGVDALGKPFRRVSAEPTGR